VIEVFLSQEHIADDLPFVPGGQSPKRNMRTYPGAHPRTAALFIFKTAAIDRKQLRLPARAHNLMKYVKLKQETLRRA
jgi:hypothetical protein